MVAEPIRIFVDSSSMSDDDMPQLISSSDDESFDDDEDDVEYEEPYGYEKPGVFFILMTTILHSL